MSALGNRGTAASSAYFICGFETSRQKHLQLKMPERFLKEENCGGTEKQKNKKQKTLGPGNFPQAVLGMRGGNPNDARLPCTLTKNRYFRKSKVKKREHAPFGSQAPLGQGLPHSHPSVPPRIAGQPWTGQLLQALALARVRAPGAPRGVAAAAAPGPAGSPGSTLTARASFPRHLLPSSSPPFLFENREGKKSEMPLSACSFRGAGIIYSLG